MEKNFMNTTFTTDVSQEQNLADQSYQQQNEVNPQQFDYNEVKTLLSWSAPGRPFTKKSKHYYLNILTIMLLIQIILFLFGQYVLMMLVLSVVFLAYVLGSVAPRYFHYKITSEGIMVEDHFFIWDELYDFYFKRKNGEDVLIVGTKAFFPGELMLVLGELHKEQVKSILLPYLPYREYVKPTFTEKAAEWLEKNFPLDKHQTPSQV
ncbi:MAG: hypothetical protein KatS3mg089_0002 [Patescibacteria group bacterium]|nr:MAG: hypothetical protein KatS3mg089_0002 [Patescibacteria group bacterium]